MLQAALRERAARFALLPSLSSASAVCVGCRSPVRIDRRSSKRSVPSALVVPLPSETGQRFCFSCSPKYTSISSTSAARQIRAVTYLSYTPLVAVGCRCGSLGFCPSPLLSHSEFLYVVFESGRRETQEHQWPTFRAVTARRYFCVELILRPSSQNRGNLACDKHSYF